MKEVIRVLSLDGGGMRGIIPALFLAKLEERAGRPIHRLFDLIAGTSTGGILACGLTALGQQGRPLYSARELVDFYVEDGPRIFSRSLWHRAGALGNLIEERYPSSRVEEVLARRFGETRLKDTLTDVLIPAYEIERRAPFFFRTRYARRPPRPEMYDFPLWQVARATSAAPTYFEPLRIDAGPDDYYALVDGGVFANNPGMCAWAEARALHPTARIVLVSLGTGELTRRIPWDDAKGWGLVGWARPILDVVFDGVSDTVDFQLRQVLPDDYHRFQVRLDEGSDDLDDASGTNLRVLRLLAEDLVRAAEPQLDALIATLAPGEAVS